MKMIFTTLFFGTLFILWGASLIIEALFGIGLPLGKLIFSCLLIYVGILLIKGLNPAPANHKTILFGKETIRELHSSHYTEYKIVFGQGIIDLSNLAIESSGTTTIKVFVLFGNAQIRLNPAVATTIKADAILSAIELPDQSTISLGSYLYKSDMSNELPQLHIDVTGIFSAIEVRK
jgi:predicted membrane protein